MITIRANRKLASLVFVVSAWLIGFVPLAQAHFLFIQVGPHAEAGRSAEVFFSERATAGDPKFVSKIAHTELWLQDEPGKLRPLQVNRGSDRLRAYLSSGKSVSVIGRCEYGVLKREKSFLLRYYPKAVSGKPVEIANLTRHEAIPLEIMPTFEKDTIMFTVLRHGQPLPNAVLTTIDADLSNEELKANAAGQATWRITEPGPYAIYVKHVVPESGTKDGQSFDEIREFATLAFDWPLDQSRVDADAVAMFERAIATRAQWPDFKGFTAHAEVYVDGRLSEGPISVKADGDVAFDAAVKIDSNSKIDDEAAREWIRDQLHSIVIHRVPSSGIQAKPVLSFADRDIAHPLGRLLNFHGGRFAATYRIRDDEIIVVNRHLGQENMSLQMLESERNAAGQVLPRSYQVQYRDAATGSIIRVESFTARWQQVGKYDLPKSLTQSISAPGGVSTRSLKLTSPELAK